MSVIRVASYAAAFLAATAFAALAHEPKLALTVTNKDYPASIGALENTHRGGGERMGSALGFAVARKQDLDKGSMIAGVADYVGRLEKAGPEAVKPCAL